MNGPGCLPPSGEIWTIRAVRLLDVAGLLAGLDPATAIHIPEIQRGSAWDARRVLDLWDSLFRGFPIGAFYVASRSEEPGYDLLDGQQRLRALLVCLKPKEGEEEKVLGNRKLDGRCLWVEVDPDLPKDARHPALYLTSEAQPFGYQEDGRKLPTWKRRDARRKYAGLGDETDDAAEDDGLHIAGQRGTLAYDLDLFAKNIEDRNGRELPRPPRPYGGKRPVRLQPLLAAWHTALGASDRPSPDDQGRGQRIAAMQARAVAELTERQEDNGFASAYVLAEKPFRALDDAFCRLAASEVALINCRLERDEDRLRLFRRIGENGVALSQEERLYSVLKSKIPKARETVEAIYDADGTHGAKAVGRILLPTKIVATALRVASKCAGRAPNLPSPEDLSAILPGPRHGDGKPGTFEEAFRAEFSRLMPATGDPSASPLCKAFATSKQLLEHSDAAGDYWLPDAIVAQLPEQLWFVMVYWASRPEAGFTCDDRKEAVRLALFWLLAVEEPADAMVRAVAVIDKVVEGKKAGFPGRAIYVDLVAPGDGARMIAHPLTEPQRFGKERGAEWRRDVERFGKDGVEWPIGLAWWTHAATMLLWLQRDYVTKAFQGYRPLASHEDDVPWDFDHLVPKDSWQWDGRSKLGRYQDVGDLKDELKRPNEYVLRERVWQFANRIGNLRIVNASTNRAQGNEALTIKMPLLFAPTEGSSAAAATEAQKWLMPKPSENPIELTDWTTASTAAGREVWSRTERAAFQDAVEERAFRLYEEFFCTLGFHSWVNLDGHGTAAAGE